MAKDKYLEELEKAYERTWNTKDKADIARQINNYEANRIQEEKNAIDKMYFESGISRRTNEPVQEAKEPSPRRGVLDRILSPINNSSVTSALYNMTDDDPTTTALQGIRAGLSKQFNVFKNDISDVHYGSEVINNIARGGEAPTSTVGKVTTAVGGFALDVLTDPMAYLGGVASAPKKLLEGFGNAPLATKADFELNTAKRVLEKDLNRISKLSNEEIIKAARAKIGDDLFENITSATMNQFNQRVLRVNTMDAVKEEQGITFGIGNLPFLQKKLQKKGMEGAFKKELVSSMEMRQFGKDHWSPYYNQMLNRLRVSKVGQAFSDYNKILADLGDGLNETNKAQKIQDAITTFTYKESLKDLDARVADKAIRDIVEPLNRKFNGVIDKEGAEVLNEAYKSGDLSKFRTVIEYQRDVQKKALEAMKYKGDAGLAIKEMEAKIEMNNKLINSIDDFVKLRRTPFQSASKIKLSEIKVNPVDKLDDIFTGSVNKELAQRRVSNLRANENIVWNLAQNEKNKILDIIEDAELEILKIDDALGNMSLSADERFVQGLEKSNIKMNIEALRNEFNIIDKARTLEDMKNSSFIRRAAIAIDDLDELGEGRASMLGLFDDTTRDGMSFQKMMDYLNGKFNPGYEFKTGGKKYTYREFVNGFDEARIVPDKASTNLSEEIAKKGKMKLKEIGYAPEDGNIEWLNMSVDELQNFINKSYRNGEYNFTQKLMDMSSDEITQMYANGNEHTRKVIDQFNKNKILPNKKDITPKEVEELQDFVKEKRDRLAAETTRLNNDITKIREQGIEKYFEDTMAEIGEQQRNVDDLKKAIVKYDELEKITKSSDGSGNLFDFIDDLNKERVKKLNEVSFVGTKQADHELRQTIPFKMSDEAKEFFATRKGEGEYRLKTLMYDAQQEGWSIEKLNKRVKEMTEQMIKNSLFESENVKPVEKAFEDDFMSAFISKAINDGAQLEQAPMITMYLNNFGKKFTEGMKLADDEILVVRTSAIRKRVEEFAKENKAPNARLHNDYNWLEKNLGITGKHMRKNNTFTELTTRQWEQFANHYGKYPVGGMDMVKPYVMKKKAAHLLQDGIIYQNAERQKNFFDLFNDTAIVRTLDNMQQFWKASNTVINPGFHVNNAIGNAANSYLSGYESVLNPSKIKIANTIYKNGDPLQTVVLNGTKYTYQQIKEIATAAGIIDDSFFTTEILKGKSWNELPLFRKGFDLGSQIEGSQRLTLFMQYLDDGYDAQHATSMVNKFLFDYSDLTVEENEIFKRAIPFYTFMRKNLPLQLEQIMEQPQLYATFFKGKNAIEFMAGDDYVPPYKRSEWREDYIQLPFKIEGKNIGLGGNLPINQFGRLDSFGKIMGQTSPFIKIPYELSRGEYAYTGMPIGDEYGSYAMSQFTPTRIFDVTQDKTGPDKYLYPMGALSGVPVATIKGKTLSQLTQERKKKNKKKYDQEHKSQYFKK